MTDAKSGSICDDREYEKREYSTRFGSNTMYCDLETHHQEDSGNGYAQHKVTTLTDEVSLCSANHARLWRLLALRLLARCGADLSMLPALRLVCLADLVARSVHDHVGNLRCKCQLAVYDPDSTHSHPIWDLSLAR